MKTFYFEGNLYWNRINTIEDIKKLLSFYSYNELRKAKINPDSSEDLPCFGFYSEYNGKLTLGKWIDENKLNKYFEI